MSGTVRPFLFERLFDAIRVALLISSGQRPPLAAETRGRALKVLADHYVAKPDSVGPPVPVCDVAVVPEDFAGDEPDPSNPRGPDVRGELWVKGPNVVRGYWNRPEETAKTVVVPTR